MNIIHDILKKRLDIKSFLIINYLITFVILYAVFKLSSISANFAIENLIYKDQRIHYSSLTELYNKDFSKINIDTIEKTGAWVEILDENKKVIYIKGQKKDNVMQYSEKQFLEMILSQKPAYDENPWIADAVTVEGNNGESYIFLLKLDSRKVSKSMIYEPSLLEKDDLFLILKTLGVRFTFIAIYLFISIYIYSIISSKFITNPLRSFIYGFKKMKDLNYDTRVKIQGLKELEEVEREFNKMAIKLQQVENENRRIDESKKRLLVDISHDLKTPITSIQGFSKLILEETVTDEEKKKFLNIIYNKATYSTILIDDLFELSKLEDSEYNILLEEDDFAEWTRRLIIEYYEEFKNKGFFLEIDISEKPIQLKFDQKLMKRAIVNIFNNCMKHNKSGTIIKISCYVKDNSILLQISDNGDGIDENLRDKIFEPFIKSDAKKSAGSGLGLAITKKIIEKHGGSIILLSTENEKTIFRISILI